MERLLPSSRYTLRLLLKSPGFTITAVLILGFGIGANTAIFSLIDAVLLKPLPYPSPERLVVVSQETPNSPLAWVDYPDYQDFCRSQRSFEDLGVMREWHFDLSGQGDPPRLFGGYVSKDTKAEEKLTQSRKGARQRGNQNGCKKRKERKFNELQEFRKS